MKGTNEFIIGKYISPVHDAYGKKGLVSGHHRIKMCQLATENTDIMIDDWEVKQSTHTPTKFVLDHFSDSLMNHLGLKIKVLFVCGADLLLSFNIPNLWLESHIISILNDYGLVCIQREGFEQVENELITKYSHNVKMINQWLPDYTSSTKLRFAVENGFSIRYLTHDLVIQYIEENKLYL